jgi:cytochrome c oxidase subunit 4
MPRTLRVPLATAGVLLVLWLAELLLAWLGLGIWAPLLGLVMAALVAAGFMRLGRAAPLSRVFAIAGLFWLLVLLGLGSMDPLTRTDYLLRQDAAPAGTVPALPAGQ